MRRSIPRNPRGIGGAKGPLHRSPIKHHTHPTPDFRTPRASTVRSDTPPPTGTGRPAPQWDEAGPTASARNSLRRWASVHSPRTPGASHRECTRHDQLLLDPRLRKGAPHPCSASFPRASMPAPLRGRRLSNPPPYESPENWAALTLRPSWPTLCRGLVLGRLRLVPRLRPSAPAIHGLRSGGHPWPALGSLPAASVPPDKALSTTKPSQPRTLSTASGQREWSTGEDSWGALTSLPLPRSCRE